MRIGDGRELVMSVLSGLTLITAVYAWNVSQPYQHQAIQLRSVAPANSGAVTSSFAPTIKVGETAASLAISPELRLRFDYALNRHGVRAEYELPSYLRSDYRPAQLNILKDLFRRYASYQEEWRALEATHKTAYANLPVYQNVSQRLLAMHELRAHYFSAREEQALFAIDDEYDKQQLQQLLLKDSTVSMEEELVVAKTLLVADQQIRNYHGYYLQRLSDE